MLRDFLTFQESFLTTIKTPMTTQQATFEYLEKNQFLLNSAVAAVPPDMRIVVIDRPGEFEEMKSYKERVADLVTEKKEASKVSVPKSTVDVRPFKKHLRPQLGGLQPYPR